MNLLEVKFLKFVVLFRRTIEMLYNFDTYIRELRWKKSRDANCTTNQGLNDVKPYKWHNTIEI